MKKQKTIVITGASDGVGAAAAGELKGRGHEVVIVGRSASKTSRVAGQLGSKFFLADFAELASVRQLAHDLAERYPRIDVLANNAGGIMGDREVTVDGHEMTFQVNHLAPFLLTTLLLPTLISSDATVIQTASAAARAYGRFDINDLDNERDYAPQRAYGNGKLANILFTSELHRRYSAQGVSAVAFHPGVVRTSFAKDTTHPMRRIYHGPLRALFTVSPEKAAEQLVAFSDGATFESGRYYERGSIAHRVNPDSQDPQLAEQLWERSERMLAA